MRHVGTLYVNIAISLLLVPDNLTSRTFALHIAKESYGFAQLNQLRQVCKTPWQDDCHSQKDFAMSDWRHNDVKHMPHRQMHSFYRQNKPVSRKAPPALVLEYR